MKIDKLNFGTAGTPIVSEDRSPFAGLNTLQDLKLDSMELEFVRRIYLSEENAELLKSKNKNILLSCHAPYYINLNSQEEVKKKASIKRIFDSAMIASKAGAYSVCFHPAYYMKTDKEKTFQIVKKSVKMIVDELQDHSVNIFVSPETTGKASQFGDYEELIRLSEEVEQVQPCIDFSHVYARNAGKFNSYENYFKILALIEKKLGKTFLSHMHIHMSGIEFSDKGERYHLPLKESKFNYKAVLKVLKEFNVKGSVISESPIIEQDALLMKKDYNQLK